MWKALFKKQLLEMLSPFMRDRKSGKQRGTGGLILIGVLFLFLAVSFFVTFFGMATLLADAFLPMGLDWLYFAVFGLISAAVSVLTSVFSAYSGLYLANDNEMLLAMPIPPSSILTVRMTAIYGTCFLSGAIVFLPAIVAYQMKAGLSLSLIPQILLFFLLPMLSLTLVCLLGYLVALLFSHTKHKSTLSVVMFLIFFVGYFYIINNGNDLLISLAAKPDAVSAAMHSYLYPFSQVGLAAVGDPLAFLIFVLIAVIPLGLVVFILSRNFLSLSLKKVDTAGKKVSFSGKTGSLGKALLKKEGKRFTSSPTYLINCGFGLLVMPLFAVLLFIKRGNLSYALTKISQAIPALSGYEILLAFLAIAVIVPTCDISAPSISLEGKQLWIIRSLPIPAKEILLAKEKLHIYVALLPSLLMALSLAISFGLGIGEAVLLFVFTLLVIVLSAGGGLFFDLLKPDFNWVSETKPIKQNLSVLLALFSGFFIAILIGVSAYLLRNFFTPFATMLLCTLLLGVITALEQWWLFTKGAAKVDSLS